MRDDWDWALCAVSDCADVVNCVFGEERREELMHHLHDRVHLWQSRDHPSFQPLGATDNLQATALEISDFPLLAPCHGKSSAMRMMVLTDSIQLWRGSTIW